MMTNDLTSRENVERLAKWADGEAIAAYGEYAVDHPDEHEGSQVASALRALSARLAEVEKERAEANLRDESSRMVLATVLAERDEVRARMEAAYKEAETLLSQIFDNVVDQKGSGQKK